MDENEFRIVDVNGNEFTQYNIGKTMDPLTLSKKIKSGNIDVKNIDIYESFEGCLDYLITDKTTFNKIVEFGMLYALYQDDFLAFKEMLNDYALNIEKYSYSYLNECIESVKKYDSFDEYGLNIVTGIVTDLDDLEGIIDYIDLVRLAKDALDFKFYIKWNDLLYVFPDID